MENLFWHDASEFSCSPRKGLIIDKLFQISFTATSEASLVTSAGVPADVRPTSRRRRQDVRGRSRGNSRRNVRRNVCRRPADVRPTSRRRREDVSGRFGGNSRRNVCGNVRGRPADVLGRRADVRRRSFGRSCRNSCGNSFGNSFQCEPGFRVCYRRCVVADTRLACVPATPVRIAAAI